MPPVPEVARESRRGRNAPAYRHPSPNRDRHPPGTPASAPVPFNTWDSMVPAFVEVVGEDVEGAANPSDNGLRMTLKPRLGRTRA